MISLFFILIIHNIHKHIYIQTTNHEPYACTKNIKIVEQFSLDTVVHTYKLINTVYRHMSIYQTDCIYIKKLRSKKFSEIRKKFKKIPKLE